MRKILYALSLALGLCAAGAPAALAQDVPAPLKAAKAGDLGTVLTGPNGMTLYTFKNDKEGKSVCNGPCAENWPPFKPEAGAPAPKAPLGLITRDDGGKQYAWKGQPLYYWKNDKKPGDTTGHMARNIWFVAKP
jgi:predicted lipoprotein with Yx(FWY)xxD motif